ncbi:hypothetical protein PTTG_30698 [Puccinia triticina 1-1 BBBD Race 1]|uniref:Chromo domain-containing protein n=1 Tax=Puccinia triticina (isolate 1-1 / race 1 (BBBD)) TaxID=630390 RepID=A0A180FXT7_PUCT1|nr:hypothetical protein PTTG_30698 [Puccinia triticina 1-1 BBBD Race 1]
MRGVHPNFHVSVLRKHNPDSIEGRTPDEPGAVVVDGKEEWEVEEILDCRRQGKKIQYLVAWKGYGPDTNSWEPDINLTNCKELVEEFNSKFPDAAGQHQRRRRFK